MCECGYYYIGLGEGAKGKGGRKKHVALAHLSSMNRLGSLIEVYRPNE